MSGKLPHWQTALTDMTDDDLAALVAFREDELKTEWCATLIRQDLDELRREQNRRALVQAVNGPASLHGVRITRR